MSRRRPDEDPTFGLRYARDVAVHRLDLAEARRIAVRAQLLDAPRPTDLLEVVHQLTLLQIDPTAAVAPSADLVAWSRLGSSYQPAHLQHALEQDRTLFEFNATIRPMSDLGLYLADMATWPTREWAREWLRANDRFRRDILDRLGTSGPLLSRDIPDTSSGAVAVVGLDQRPQRHPDARVPDGARRDRDRRAPWPAARLGPRRAGVPGRHAGRPGGRGTPAPERAAAAVAGHRAREDDRRPVEPWDVGDAGEPATSRASRGVARGPGGAREALRGAHGPAVAVRSPDPRPRPRRRAVRLRLRPGDVQAQGQAAVGLLRAARPARRSARRQGGRHGRPQGREAARGRHPPGRPVHPRDQPGRRRRARSARVVARPRTVERTV